MKNLVFGLVATILFAFNASAQDTNSSEQKESAIMSVKSGDEVIKYKFNSIKEFEDNTDKILDELTENANKVGACEVTVEISITVNTGVASTTVTATITAPCANVAAAVKKMRAQLIAALTS